MFVIVITTNYRSSIIIIIIIMMLRYRTYIQHNATTLGGKNDALQPNSLQSITTLPLNAKLNCSYLAAIRFTSLYRLLLCACAKD